MAMKISLVLVCIALLIIPSLSQPTFVGGTYGTNWLAANGNKIVVPNATAIPNATIVPNATGLWSWGGIPLGNTLQSGKLVSTGDSGDTLLVYPAFSESQSPSALDNLMSPSNVSAGQLPALGSGYYIDNRTLNSAQNGPRGLNAQQIASPYLSEDPWAVANEIGQPILTHSVY